MRISIARAIFRRSAAEQTALRFITQWLGIAGLIIVGLLASSIPVSAEQRIEVIAGNNLPVCEEYLRALQDWPATGMRCLADLPISSKKLRRLTRSVTKINFTADETDPTLRLRRNVWAFVRDNDVNSANYFYPGSLSEWKGRTDQLEVVNQELSNVSSRYLTDSAVRLLTIDLDNDGKRDRIFVYPRCVLGGNVVNTATYSSPVFLKNGSDDVDIQRTLTYLRAPSRSMPNEGIRVSTAGKPVAVADVFRNGAYGFMTFNGRTYFDFWWDAAEEAVPDSASRNVVRLYLPNKHESEQVCAFRIGVHE